MSSVSHGSFAVPDILLTLLASLVHPGYLNQRAWCAHLTRVFDFDMSTRKIELRVHDVGEYMLESNEIFAWRCRRRDSKVPLRKNEDQPTAVDESA